MGMFRRVVKGLAVATTVVFAFALTGCLGFGSFGVFSRDNGDLTLGGAELVEYPSCIEIEWVAGKVAIKRYEGDTLAFSEVPTSARELDDEILLAWEVRGDTLHIQFVRSDRHPQGLVKELTVLVPESMEIDDIIVTATSADVVLPELTADSITVTTTSGDILATCITRLVSFTSTSGDITVACEASGFHVASTSGNQAVTQSGPADNMDLESTSGSISLVQRGQVREAEVESTSGSVRVDLVAIGSLEVETTSGAVELLAPSDWGFSGTVSTVSGHITAFPGLQRLGSTVSCGDGSHDLEISTTSGDIMLKVK